MDYIRQQLIEKMAKAVLSRPTTSKADPPAPAQKIKRIKYPFLPEEEPPEPTCLEALKRVVDERFLRRVESEKETYKALINDAQALINYIEQTYNPREAVKKDAPKWQKEMISREPKLKTVFKIFDFIKGNTRPYAATPHNPRKKETDYVYFEPDYRFMATSISDVNHYRCLTGLTSLHRHT